MDQNEKTTCAQGTILNCIGLQVEGGVTAVTYTYKLFKSYIEMQKNTGTLCKKSINEEPLAVKGRHTDLLCILVDSESELSLTSTLNGFGIDFNVATSRDVPYTLYVVSEPVATERAIQSTGAKIVSYCYLSVKDIGLPDRPEVDSESEYVGIVRGVGVDGYFDPDIYWKEMADIGSRVAEWYVKATPEQREGLRAETKSLDDLAKEAREYVTAIENGLTPPSQLAQEPIDPDADQEYGVTAGAGVLGEKILIAVQQEVGNIGNTLTNYDDTIDLSERALGM